MYISVSAVVLVFAPRFYKRDSYLCFLKQRMCWVSC